MNLDIQKIRLHELESFVRSKTYFELDTIPITPNRAISYINNPHAKPEDIVLYLGFSDKLLVAFRTIFADTINLDKQQIRFGWCSGNWVHSNHRRKGFSEQLLQEVYSDWSGNLMFANYAPNAEKLYLKTGWFHAVHQFTGVRGYLFPSTKKLCTSGHINGISKLLLSILDFLISITSSFRVLFFSIKTHSNVRFETIPVPDEQCFNFKNNNNRTYLFNRDKDELNWIFQFPWISTSDKSFNDKYPFSSYSSSFYYKTVKVFIENIFAGYFIISVHNGHLKTLYFNLSGEIESEIANFLKQFCKKNKIEMITVYNNRVAQQLFKRKFPFLHVKKYGQKIYSSFKINNEKELQFQDGDGDVIFT